MPASSTVTFAALQLNLNGSMEDNLARVSAMIRQAAAKGAQIILPPELFQGPYFCREEKEEFFSGARTLDEHPVLQAMIPLARELEVAIPVSLFERDGQAYYNSLAMVDAGGSVLGTYRKSHIPDGPGYEEKFYFRPGNTGFKVWKTRFATIGVGVCWDQWFPECARAMVLMGADFLLYPTAIGSEPEEPQLDTSAMWQRVMQGHAVANVAPVIAANRIGDEGGQLFYGHSFICDAYGELVREAGPADEAILTCSFDPSEIRAKRASMGFFRDRRPELYAELTRPV
ncbi:MAG: N-carbamoylputrescine amidase [Oceanipulchritudo sp.]